MFDECKNYCDTLLLLLHDDPSIERPEKIKPILSLNERIMVLDSLKQIDRIITYKTESDLYEILMNKKKLSTPAGPPVTPNGDQNQFNSCKNMKIARANCSLWPFREPPGAPMVAQGRPKTAQGTSSLIFCRFWMDFSRSLIHFRCFFNDFV